MALCSGNGGARAAVRARGGVVPPLAPLVEDGRGGVPAGAAPKPSILERCLQAPYSGNPKPQTLNPTP